MPGEIRNTISKLEGDNQRLDMYINELNECIRDLHSFANNNLYSEWEGNAADAFIDKLNELNSYYSNCCYAFKDLSDIQKDALEEYTSAENNAKSAIQSIDI